MRLQPNDILYTLATNGKVAESRLTGALQTTDYDPKDLSVPDNPLTALGTAAQLTPPAGYPAGSRQT